jgi:hypothetical protein
MLARYVSLLQFTLVTQKLEGFKNVVIMYLRVKISRIRLFKGVYSFYFRLSKEATDESLRMFFIQFYYFT